MEIKIRGKTVELPQFKERGFILWEGISKIDRETPVVLIATTSTKNPKTGPMIQTWILSRDKNPVEALRDGSDSAICGDCKHRGPGDGSHRSCYVSVGQAPNNIHKSYLKGNYSRLTSFRIFKGAFIRFGAYGDPAAVPYGIWYRLAMQARGWTGYTSQYKNCDVRLKNICMASVGSVKEMKDAQNRGWKTYRTRTKDEPHQELEFSCPASTEQNHRLNCAECLACSGTRFGKSKYGSPNIIVHGDFFKVNSYKGNFAKSQS